MDEILAIEAHLLAIVGLLVVVQVGLAVAALVSLIRTPGPIAGEKLVWLLVALLVNMLGPLLYFAIGRSRLASREQDHVEVRVAPAEAERAAGAVFAARVDPGQEDAQTASGSPGGRGAG